MLSVCLCVCVSPFPTNVWIPEPIFKKLGMHIMALEPISTAYFRNPSHQSVCLYVHPTIVARQRLGNNVTAATNTSSNRRVVGRIVFYVARVVLSKVLD
jgi:hypothetical protein